MGRGFVLSLIGLYIIIIFCLIAWRWNWKSSKGKLVFYWRKPFVRIFTASLLIPLNFYLNLEDPSGQSRALASAGPFGMPINLLIGAWPPDVLFKVLKACFGVFGIITGFYIGIVEVHHRLLRDRLNLEIFEKNRGSWLVGIIVCWLWMVLVAYLYNFLFITLFAFWNLPTVQPITGTFTITNIVLQKITSSVCTIGDIFTFVMVVDTMLQDTGRYETWVSPGARNRWRSIRMPCMLSFLLVLGGIMVSSIWGGIFFFYHNHLWPFPGSTEDVRAGLAGLIGLLNMSVVTQDWEFPSFDNPLELNMAFCSVDTLMLCNRIISKKPFTWFRKKKLKRISVEGKWFNFTFLVITMLLDFNCLRGLVQYSPVINSQYVDPSLRVWTVADEAAAQSPRTIFSWAARRGNFSDYRLNCFYISGRTVIGYVLALAPYTIGLFMVVEFIRRYNRDPEDVARRKRLRYLRQIAAVSVMKMVARRAKIKRGTFENENPNKEAEEFKSLLKNENSNKEAEAFKSLLATMTPTTKSAVHESDGLGDAESRPPDPFIIPETLQSRNGSLCFTQNIVRSSSLLLAPTPASALSKTPSINAMSANSAFSYGTLPSTNLNAKTLILPPFEEELFEPLPSTILNPKTLILPPLEDDLYEQYEQYEQYADDLHGQIAEVTATLNRSMLLNPDGTAYATMLSGEAACVLESLRTLDC